MLEDCLDGLLILAFVLGLGEEKKVFNKEKNCVCFKRRFSKQILRTIQSLYGDNLLSAALFTLT